MGDRDLSRVISGGLAETRCLTRGGLADCGDQVPACGGGDTGDSDLVSLLPTMESMENPNLFFISLLKIF